MQSRRSHPPRVVALVLLGFVAQALVPRASWYAHRHAGAERGHVHAWDGTRVAATTGSLRDLLSDQHDHEHADTPGHVHDHPHGDLAAAALAPGGRVDGDPGTTHGHEVPPATARHGDAPPGVNARTGHDHARPSAGPALVASHDGNHQHAQSPFQIVVASHVPHLIPASREGAIAPRTAPRPPLAPARALRARAPPYAPV